MEHGCTSSSWHSGSQSVANIETDSASRGRPYRPQHAEGHADLKVCWTHGWPKHHFRLMYVAL